MTNSPNDDNAQILVDLNPPGSMVEVALEPQALVNKSKEAINKAMDTINHMAERTIDAIGNVTNKPSEVEVEFGIKLDAESGALIAKTGAEASLTVKMVWKS
ncbi:MAG: CU044_2847 family protein [Cyanobacteria bacterium P01_F01_bin.143]